MDVMQARNAFREILVNDDFNPCLNYKKCFNFDVGTRENPIVTRIFLTSSKHYKEMRLNDINIVDTCVEDMYLNTPFCLDLGHSYNIPFHRLILDNYLYPIFDTTPVNRLLLCY